MNKNVEAAFTTVLLLSGGIALSLGLAFGVLRATVRAMSPAAAPTTSSASNSPQPVSIHSANTLPAA
jgi:hypothetical protein